MSGENLFWAIVGGGILNILWNLMAHYLTPFTDRVLEGVSGSYRKFNKERQERIGKRVERMIADPHEVTRAHITNVTYQQNTLIWLLMWMVVGVWFFLSQELSLRSPANLGAMLIIGTVWGVAGMMLLISRRSEVLSALREYRELTNRDQEE